MNLQIKVKQNRVGLIPASVQRPSGAGATCLAVSPQRSVPLDLCAELQDALQRAYEVRDFEAYAAMLERAK